MFVCMIMRFPLHCSGPGYWLLSRPVVPPHQSDHSEQLLSGESSHPTRHKIGHENIRLSYTKVLTHILWCYLECYGQTLQTVDRIIFINIRIYSFIHLHTYIHIYAFIYTYTNT